MGLNITISRNGTGDETLAAAQRVEIFESMGSTTLYSIFYDEDIAEGDMPLLKDGRFDPGSILSVATEVNDEMICLVKGPVYSQNIFLQHGGEGSRLEVRGSDSCLNMDQEYKTKIWNDVTDSDVVTNILGSYSLTPDVGFTQARHTENKHSLVQNESDLSLVRRLARRNGCYFWITCDGLAELETGHFQRPKLDANPLAELIINDKNSNISNLQITWNTDRPSSVVNKQMDMNTKGILDGNVSKTPQVLLGTKGLQDISGKTHSASIITTGDDAGNLKSKSEGALIDSDWFIRATCSTTLHQLGKLVKSHSVVNVQGAGSRHSGKYFVHSVRHLIDAAVHVMEIELVRNGWDESGSSMPETAKIF